LSGRGLCDELITRPEESYRLCCVVVCDLETSRMGAPYIYDISHLRVKFDGLIYSLKISLQFNMRQELQIFAFALLLLFYIFYSYLLLLLLLRNS